jgi:hypothetical protein
VVVAHRPVVSRAAAVMRQGPAAVLGLGGGDGPGFWGRASTAVLLAALAIGLVTINIVQDNDRAVDIADLDAALLTDDLPPQAYADPVSCSSSRPAPGARHRLVGRPPRDLRRLARVHARPEPSCPLACGAARPGRPVAGLGRPGAGRGRGRPTRPAHAAASNGIAWRDLTARQKTALAPLKEQWPTLSVEHQRKWIALARNYHRLKPAEQATLQQRMSDWAQLSPSQRTRARLNFGEARRLPADEKRAQWEAYQALSEQERERLAQDRPKPPSPPRRPCAPPRPAPSHGPCCPPRLLPTAPAATSAPACR